PRLTCRLPKLYATLFHLEPRFYTLLMVDPDVSDEENQSFKTYLYWLHCVFPFRSHHAIVNMI
ncbi:hypothetical protein EDB83DRAFT_2237113, partial [Lactarius deliciosus]